MNDSQLRWRVRRYAIIIGLILYIITATILSFNLQSSFFDERGLKIIVLVIGLLCFVMFSLTYIVISVFLSSYIKNEIYESIISFILSPVVIGVISGVAKIINSQV
jgi:hypothetical protein